MASAMDKELAQYRDLMAVPDKFEEGFGPKTVIGAIFLGILMVPASMYLSLFVGHGIGGAAQWVTVILFAEVVKRSMKSLRQQEIFVLFYMAGQVIGAPYSGLLWTQYFVQSPAAIGSGIAAEIPWWSAPSAKEISEHGRTFFDGLWLAPHWQVPILFSLGMMVIGKIDRLGLGYALYRITAHVEKLPFPMAPIGAMGITVLADREDGSHKWRWRAFGFGGVVGLVWGGVTVGLPAISGAILARPITVFPIPWLDLTPQLSTPSFLPAVGLNLIFELGAVLAGMVLPFWAVMGGFIGVIITMLVNPILYHSGQLPTWRPGMGIVETTFSNNMDFYISFGIGLTFAIFIVSIIPLLKPMLRVFGFFKEDALGDERFVWSRANVWRILTERNRDRGDISIFVSLCIYVFSTCTYLAICCWMMPGTAEKNYVDKFPFWFFLGFAFLYQPMISYTNAKLEGIVGQHVGIPLVNQAAFILSGYQGATIWFAPIPMNDFSGAVGGFRTMELTGTRLTSIIKTELLTFPIVVITSILFAQLIWSLAPLPSASYPYTQETWHLQALTTCITFTSTMGGTSPFLEAIKLDVVGAGFGLGLASFAFLTFLNLPTLLVYGVVRGLNQSTPGVLIPEIIGALSARYYFERRFGQKKFREWIITMSAGFGAGVGLMSMIAVAVALIVKSTTTLGY